MDDSLITFATACSGIGAPEIAWHDGLGWKPVFVAEIERFPSAVLKHHWPDAPNLGDMTKIDAAQYEIDVFCAGTPCQSFSIAGLRNGLNDDRGNLTLTYVELVHAIRSLHAAVWENVPGVLSDKTNAFGCLLAGLVGADDPLPYPTKQGRWPDTGMVAGPLGLACWRILDAKFFGLAQRRRRVLVVFCPSARGGDPSAILFERKGMYGNPASGKKQREGIAGTLTPGAHPGGFNGQDAYSNLLGPTGLDGQLASSDLCPSLRAQAQHSHRLDSAAVVAMAFGGGNTSGPLDVTATLTATLTAKGNRQDFEVETFITQPVAFSHQAGGMQTTLGYDEKSGTSPSLTTTQTPAVAYSVALRGREGGGTIELGGEIAGTIRASQGGGDKPHVMTQMAVRRLTPIECERLQGFEDGHTDIYENTPDGPRYKAIGNSMAVPMMKWLGRRIEADIKRVRGQK